MQSNYLLGKLGGLTLTAC